MGERDSAVELAEVARELARHVRWAQGLGEKTAPLPSAAALALPAAARPTAPLAGMAPPQPGFEPPAAPAVRGEAPAPRFGAPGGGAEAPPRRPAPGGGAPAPHPLPGAAAAPAPFASSAPAGMRPAEVLERLRAEVGDCRRCKLCQGRRNLVFGTGNPEAELVFVGEGPGAEEDAQGIPFVGAAGQLLTRMIEAMGYARAEVYICNVVKCRPPRNRNPEPDEIEACEPILQAQLAALQPKAIVALGKFAAQTLLRDPSPITRLRGTWREYRGIPLMPTFHPAYLLRSPEEKARAWSDLKQVMARLGKAPPARR